MALTPGEVTAIAEELKKLIAENKFQKLKASLQDIASTDFSALRSEIAAAGTVSTDSFDAATTAVDRYRQSIIASAQAQKDSAERAAAAATDELEKSKLLKEAAEARLELLEKRLALGEDVQALIDAEKDHVRELGKEYKALDKEISAANKSGEELFDSFKSLAKGDLVGGLKGLGKTLSKGMGDKAVAKMKDGLGNLTRTIKGGGAAGAGAAAALAGLAASFVALGAVVKIGVGIIKLAIELEDASANFMRATGASREFTSSLTPITAELRKVGLSTQQASESFQVLFGSVSDFTMMSASAREEMTKNAAVLASLGVSNEDFARGSQITIKAMGQTGVQAARTQRQIAALAMDIGVAPQQMGADFANAAPKLAKFGSDGVRAFKDLAVAAKVTGIAVDRLISITDQFDTFEGAATAAGKLNAALGGNFVNAMELVTETDPVERMKMIRESILDAGLSFDEMSYYQRKFFAQSAGLQDEAELAALMSGNMDSLAGNIGKTSAEYEAMAQRSKDVQTLQDKLKTIMMQLIPVVTPLVDLLADFSKFLSENADDVAKFAKYSLYALGALGTVLGVVAIAMGSVASGVAAVIGGLAALAGLLFIDNFASSFLEGLFKVAGGFDAISIAAGAAASPITGLMKAGRAVADALFGDDGIKIGAETSAQSIQKMNVATANAASTSRAAAPTIATTNAVTSAVNNSTTNNYGGGGDSNVNIKFDNKKFADLFDVQVEKSIGRAARRALI